MTILVEIPDNKESFALEVLRSLKFVKKAEVAEQDEPELLKDIREAVHNLNLVKKGKMEAKPARELLDEL
ncbi:hypothetical protein SAMN05443429_10444 [Cruoricaptor ignavus]|uniref:Uncharacterized protein n=1 Tax=Cruoricaptor ignavus TaxID=1118202 RepID=A0A1M6DPF3_9FLAO|nr:hypothetical protein [Cruoricaptor ignavus]QOR73316.1 hypothetical protein IMZ16_07195 [Cruoricaptor ignavus]SHI74898.1 hypothetical protein SAMN05443429_10444 [Cruoricaptor ignavus]